MSVGVQKCSSPLILTLRALVLKVYVTHGLQDRASVLQLPDNRRPGAPTELQVLPIFAALPPEQQMRVGHSSNTLYHTCTLCLTVISLQCNYRLAYAYRRV
jgi:hypothetical protein